MKTIALCMVAICMINTTFAQKTRTGGTRGKTLGVHFFLQDFTSGRALDTAKLGDVLKNKIWSKPSELSPGFALSYGKGITPKVDLKATLSSSFVDYLFKSRPQFGSTDYLGELDIAGNFKALDDSHILIPYLTAGIGVSYYKGYVGAIAPVGLGLQVNLFNETFIDLQSQMRFGLTDKTTKHLYHSIGVLGRLPVVVKEKKQAVVSAPVIANKDTDGDGITDSNDQCPTEAGTAALNGCPDKDSDGIADKNDNCPEKAGTAKYNGCPVPDSDGDGINDEEDKCINQAGVARYNGCPIPDTDGDGINDEEDKCKDVPGVAEQQGCPAIDEKVKKEIDYAAKNILFQTGSAKLQSASFKGLNEVARLLKDNADIMLSIDGHTDDTGTPERNSTLSQERADAVKAYFAKKGIDEGRMTATGHGQDEPIADNANAAGKAKNRRVELKLGY